MGPCLPRFLLPPHHLVYQVPSAQRQPCCPHSPWPRQRRKRKISCSSVTTATSSPSSSAFDWTEPAAVRTCYRAEDGEDADVVQAHLGWGQLATPLPRRLARRLPSLLTCLHFEFPSFFSAFLACIFLSHLLHSFASLLLPDVFCKIYYISPQ